MNEIRTLDYEHRELMTQIVSAMRPWVTPGTKLIYRSAFRWMLDCGDGEDAQVLAGHYECMSVNQLCEDFGYTAVFDFRHVAIVSEARP